MLLPARHGRALNWTWWYYYSDHVDDSDFPFTPEYNLPLPQFLEFVHFQGCVGPSWAQQKYKNIQ